MSGDPRAWGRARRPGGGAGGGRAGVGFGRAGVGGGRHRQDGTRAGVPAHGGCSGQAADRPGPRPRTGSGRGTPSARTAGRRPPRPPAVRSTRATPRPRTSARTPRAARGAGRPPRSARTGPLASHHRPPSTTPMPSNATSVTCSTMPVVTARRPRPNSWFRTDRPAGVVGGRGGVGHGRGHRARHRQPARPVGRDRGPDGRGHGRHSTRLPAQLGFRSSERPDAAPGFHHRQRHGDQ